MTSGLRCPASFLAKPPTTAKRKNRSPATPALMRHKR